MTLKYQRHLPGDISAHMQQPLGPFVDDISSISRGHEHWVLQAQRNTNPILLQGLKKAKCKISKKDSSHSYLQTFGA
eukprot:2256970-Karenia_brevis.AAC.1